MSLDGARARQEGNNSMESGVSGRLRRGRLLLAGFSLLGLLCVLPACVAGCFRREESIVVEGERRYYRL
ncbi:MAG TPA: hypothetical protein PLH06_07045, partial [Candidatus Hydrogenedentes bacterium]|nr:hypothetical protein [Candidatus Hydrogenedentota bacterium]